MTEDPSTREVGKELFSHGDVQSPQKKAKVLDIIEDSLITLEAMLRQENLGLTPAQMTALTTAVDVMKRFKDEQVPSWIVLERTVGKCINAIPKKIWEYPKALSGDEARQYQLRIDYVRVINNFMGRVQAAVTDTLSFIGDEAHSNAAGRVQKTEPKTANP